MAKHTRHQTCSYLTSEGTLATLFDEKRDGVKIGQTADVVYNYAKVFIYPEYKSWGESGNKQAGRIVHHNYEHDGFVPLAKGGKVTATMPSVNAGSDNSRKQGLAVQYVKLITKAGLELSWTDIPSLIGSEFTIQIGTEYTIAEGLKAGDSFWSGVTVNKVIDLAISKRKEVAA